MKKLLTRVDRALELFKYATSTYLHISSCPFVDSLSPEAQHSGFDQKQCLLICQKAFFAFAHSTLEKVFFLKNFDNILSFQKSFQIFKDLFDKKFKC